MSIKNKNVVEIEFHQVEEVVDRLIEKLKKIETLTDEALSKALISHSLIVIRKTSEDKIKKINELLD